MKTNSAYLYRVFGVFFFPYWFPSSNLFPCVEAVYFVSFFHEATIRSRTVHTVVRGTDQFTHLCVLHIGRRYAWLCFQKVCLHSADATTIPVDSFRRDLWFFLYEAYFVWLPTMYFQCAVCAHLCLGLRRLGCGWLWDECSPRLLCSRKPSSCHSSRMYPAICGLEWWVRVYLYPFALPEQGNKLSFGGRCRQKPIVLRCSDRGWTSVCQIWTHQSQQSYLVLLIVPYDDSSLVVIRQNFAQLKEIYRRHCIYIIDQNESRGTAQVEAIARKK